MLTLAAARPAWGAAGSDGAKAQQCRSGGIGSRRAVRIPEHIRSGYPDAHEHTAAAVNRVPGGLVMVNGHFFAKVNGHEDIGVAGERRRGDRLRRAAGLRGERQAVPRRKPGTAGAGRKQEALSWRPPR